MGDLERLRTAMKQIASIASAAVDGDEGHDPPSGGRGGKGAKGGQRRVCTPKALPERLVEQAARMATEINPLNQPLLPMRALDGEATRFMIAAMTTKYWGREPRTLSVSFMDAPPADLRSRILSHLNAWDCGIRFEETRGLGEVRIAREAGANGGYWSYLGTDVLLIPDEEQTMNLEGFTMETPESEYRRVVRHEAGHTLGFPHEHMRKALVELIDPQKAYDYFWRRYRWTRQMVDQQVLTSLDEERLMNTPPDETSIMCYQLPGEITYDGDPILGGDDINATDAAFVESIYPRPGRRVRRSKAEVQGNGGYEAYEEHPRQTVTT